jgi:hypothetical protein
LIYTYLQEAQCAISSRSIPGHYGGLAEGVGESDALPEGAVLDTRGEEGGRVDLLPEVETGLVPGLLNVVQVKLDGRPEGGRDVRGVSVLNQPVGVGYERSSTESRSVCKVISDFMATRMNSNNIPR